MNTNATHNFYSPEKKTEENTWNITLQWEIGAEMFDKLNMRIVHLNSRAMGKCPTDYVREREKERAKVCKANGGF